MIMLVQRIDVIGLSKKSSVTAFPQQTLIFAQPLQMSSHSSQLFCLTTHDLLMIQASSLLLRVQTSPLLFKTIQFSQASKELFMGLGFLHLQFFLLATKPLSCEALANN
ncbi:hypothetical protein MPH_13745 [Macrophomina phaseolina MS6]|uniref:Uncharacterized protein n=1 Tax=Macrophomina phaseolina (strain MS6) TaxID=1126212 RepID=K2RGM2_MACPH|nr:hypothetical protein MPH_13745 [Macrophomina phaseolina MS6]